MLVVFENEDVLGQEDDFAVDSDLGVAFLAKCGKQVGKLPFSVPDDGGQQEVFGDFVVFEVANHRVGNLADDLLYRQAGGLPPAGGAVGVADPGKQQAQIVIYLGDCAHGGAGVVGGGLLVDGDGR